MKSILLSQYKKALVDDEFVISGKWSYRKDGYAFKVINGKGILMHKLILDCPKGLEIDHINGNKLDNRKSNLRIVTRSENCMNTGKRNNTYSSRFKGVSFYKRLGNWTAQVHKDYKRIFLGYFDSEIEAARAYNAKALELYGDKVKLNHV